MTLVCIVFRHAFFYHEACFNGTHRYIFLSWRWFVLCLDMHFSIMTPVSMVLTDAFFYDDAGFYIFFTDACFCHDLGLILGYVLFCHCVVIDKGVLSGSVWLRQYGATSKGWLRTRALGNS